MSDRRKILNDWKYNAGATHNDSQHTKVQDGRFEKGIITRKKETDCCQKILCSPDSSLSLSSEESPFIETVFGGLIDYSFIHSSFSFFSFPVS